jgi:hypothetical protein
VGTAHGQLLENLLKNPTLSDLVGGIQSVTLGMQFPLQPPKLAEVGNVICVPVATCLKKRGAVSKGVGTSMHSLSGPLTCQAQVLPGIELHNL